MSFFEILLLGVALSMDAFAVSVSNGMVYAKRAVRTAAECALCFGFFQFLMPLAGYFAGSFFYEQIKAIDHWIAFALLGFLGVRMVKESLRELKNQKKEENPGGIGSSSENAASSAPTGSTDSTEKKHLPYGTLIVQGIATSIDALAVGISLSAFQTGIFKSSIIIGCTTFCLTLPAVFIGKKSGDILSDKAQLLGGLILIGIGVKIFVEHVFFGG